MKLKLIALLMAAVMLSACLAGCGSEPAKVEVTESPAPTATPEPTVVPSETPAPEADARTARYRAAYEKYAPDAVVFTLGGESVTWDKYFSWLYDIATHLEDSLDFTDWNAAVPELSGAVPEATPSAYVKSYALSYAIQLAAIRLKAAEMGITLSPMQEEEIDATLAGYTEQAGGEEALAQLLSDHFLPMDYFREQHEAVAYINSLYEALYGANGEKLPDEDAVAYVKDSGYLYAKHILFSTVDDSRQPLGDDVVAEKKAEAEGVLAQLRACAPEELPELFDSLMKQYSEDPGMLSYPDGYYFVAGQMVPSFENAVLALEENGLSDLVESDYGYHIIFCPPMQADHLMDYDSNYAPCSLRSFAATQLFNNVITEWFADAEQAAKFEPAFEALDLNALLGK